MGSSRTSIPWQNKDRGPRADPEHQGAPADHHLDSNTASAEQMESGLGSHTPIAEAGRVTARWAVAHWSRTERLRFARLLFGNALREDGE